MENVQCQHKNHSTHNKTKVTYAMYRITCLKNSRKPAFRNFGTVHYSMKFQIFGIMHVDCRNVHNIALTPTNFSATQIEHFKSAHLNRVNSVMFTSGAIRIESLKFSIISNHNEISILRARTYISCTRKPLENFPREFLIPNYLLVSLP